VRAFQQIVDFFILFVFVLFITFVIVSFKHFAICSVGFLLFSARHRFHCSLLLSSALLNKRMFITIRLNI